MTETPKRRRRRRLWLIPAALVLVVVAAAAWILLGLPGESSSPVPASAAVARFRAKPPAARAPIGGSLGDRVPENGVYTYATSGSESTHILGDRRHVYPPRSTITLTRGGCGLDAVWEVLESRSERFVFCPSPGDWRLTHVGDEHEFFGHHDERLYHCTPASVALPGDRTPGSTWTSHCSIPGTTRAESGSVVGDRSAAVAGKAVPTVLLRSRVTFTGHTRGTTTILSWVEPRTGLLVRREVDAANETDTVLGALKYEEHYRLALLSLAPQR